MQTYKTMQTKQKKNQQVVKIKGQTFFVAKDINRKENLIYIFPLFILYSHVDKV